MVDTISNTVVDSISFHVGKELPSTSSGPFDAGFSDFEFLKTDSTRLFFDIDTTAALAPHDQLIQGFPGIQMPFSPTIQSIFFLFFTLCFVALSFWFNKEGPTLAGNFKNIFSGGVRSRTIFKEQITTTGVWSEMFLVFQTVLIITMVIFTFSWNRGIFNSSSNNLILLFIALFLGILLFILIKYLIYQLINYTFTEWGLGEWMEKYFRIIELTGLLIFIPALFFVFVPEYAKITLFLLIIIFFIITTAVFWNLLNIFAKNKIGLLNYFLYLCAIEIVPYFLVYKGVVSLVNIAGI